MDVGDIPEQEGRTVEATRTSFRVIEALKRLDGAGVTELAGELDLAKGTVHKHLSTLHRLDYVVKDDGSYRLAVGLLGLGVAARSRLDVYGASQDALERLAETTGRVATLMVPEHGRGIYVNQVVPADVDRVFQYEGERVPLHATAGGKAILAYTDEAVRERVFDHRGLDSLTEQTTTDRDELAAELQNVHDTRIAYDRGEYVEGEYCVASPITNEEGRAIAAVSVAGSAERMTETFARSDVPSFLGSTANSIRNRLRS
ncbi:IclR family transcriptional regulator [Halomarina pelagica]|uniref:IclR family transcriptional regulator n=1 Tax=Halomarina pelagica TaxID=2961599 RepID=UPI0020C4E266|nr:IclR family transcriptional regulator [Halomarina sp. BND7]